MRRKPNNDERSSFEPGSSNLLEVRNQFVICMVGQEGLNPTQEFSPDEDNEDGLVGSRKLIEDILDARSVNVLIQLHHLGAYAEFEEEVLDHYGHATINHAKDHHCVR
ncbi:hypothetical protein SESBI_22347 [Sesbania bispinosa]|nr:hypothetical protein SESBI_22347 [Sesbania bispinosa]